jgi:DNA primase
VRIPERIVAEIAAAADIVQVISQYVDLKRAGKDYRGLCPFHGDKDPSFYVSPQKGIFHCFGCAVGGSVFNFVMRMENVSFVEAVQTLAQRYGIPLPQASRTSATAGDEKDKLFKAVEAAQVYFRQNLQASPAVMDYLQRRGVPGEWFERIGLGFAPDSWDGIQGHLLRSGVDLRDAASVGLIKPRQSNGHYDSFRSRVMIPIRNLSGRIMAFGGRIYGEGDPKYLNSPESSLFRKRSVLYGLDDAKESIRKEGFVILVEGYFDQISLRIRGLANVVAPLGTALGTEQVKLVRRFTCEVVTIFDGDDAGLRAARRAIPLFVAEGIEPRCIILREDKDPDEAINRIGAAAFRELVDSAGSMIDFLLDELQTRYDVTTMNGRNLALEECLPALREIADSKEKDYLIERFASRLRIKEERIRRAIQPKGRNRQQVLPARREPGKSVFDFPAEECHVVRGMLLVDGGWDLVLGSGVLKDIEHPVLRTVAEKMVAYQQETGAFDPLGFCVSLQDSELASMVARWLQPHGDEDDLRPEVDALVVVSESVDAIRRRKLERRKTEIQDRMTRVPVGGDEYNLCAAELWEIAKILRK